MKAWTNKRAVSGGDASVPSTHPQPQGVVIPHPVRWHGRIAAWLIWSLLRLLAGTIRWRFDDRSHLFGPGACQPALFIIWHNRLALTVAIYHRHVRGRTGTDRQLAAMVSASRDGGLLAHILKLFRVIPIRGSSSRRGGPALREFIKAAQAGHDIALTPDGPRGPLYELQPGVIAAAQLTGLPIVPTCYELTWKISLRTWDRFQIPLPFSRCDLQFGAPFRVPANADAELRERLRKELEGILRSMARD